MKLILCFVVVLAACQEPNTAVCCGSAEDCHAVQLPEGSRCDRGKSCDDHACVASICSTDPDCSPDLPYCTDGLCVGCDATHACSPAAPVCNPTTTTCEGCTVNTECTADPTLSICGADGACRACTANAECGSQVCDSGTCVPAADVIYLAPTGDDTGACTMAAPCKGLQYALSQSKPGLQHVVLSSAVYKSDTTITITAANTPATSLFIHGNGSVISGGDVATIGAFVLASEGLPMTLEDLTITRHNSGMYTFSVSLGDAVLDRVQIVDAGPAYFDSVVAHDLVIKNASLVIQGSGSSVRLDRGWIQGGHLNVSTLATTIHLDLVDFAISTPTGTALSVGNTVVTGTIAASSFYSSAGTEAVVACGAGLFITSSIAWGAGAGRLAASGGCSFSNSIVGPTAAFGQLNADPLFVDAFLHISSTSPARDAVPCGINVVDFEGDTRPQGSACDIGADEYKP